MKKNLFLILLATAFIFSCSQEDSTTEADTDFLIRYQGAVKNVMQGKLEAKISLDSLESKKNLYGIGPIEGLKGEISIYNGELSVSTAKDGKEEINNDWDQKGVFLAYAVVSDWKSEEVDRPIARVMDIQTLIAQQSVKNGYFLNEAFPFRIETTVDTLDYHIIYKEGEMSHKEAKRPFQLVNTEVEIIGFWGGKVGRGNFTHHDSNVHLHFRTKDKKHSGHIDQIQFAQGAKLLLPARELEDPMKK